MHAVGHEQARFLRVAASGLVYVEPLGAALGRRTPGQAVETFQLLGLAEQRVWLSRGPPLLGCRLRNLPHRRRGREHDQPGPGFYLHLAQGLAVLRRERARLDRVLLRQRHRIRANQDNDFSVRNLTEAMSAAEESAKVMSILLGAIASISLLVGGIGIMNIMLVSVTERTREIGIRMAVGARGRDILWQFLVEALVLSLIGGIIGIILGVGASKIISQMFKWPTLISIQALLLSFSFAGGVGIFFGFYPARKAAQMDPIEALRFE